ncbi:hypothetical protein CHLNCDRAFT_132943 [Chlorella variabilis]|uniref:Ribosomal RNA-processing protein 43 n=1 Tax=Chlorella variabilis TaxID=554065 RepID=E1Z202_CHLVA|nr:hypothetical protein CHLNCDRAFT_132943 [Chlorella variabilis]EFN59910.1 hypothetical protein CHLNCDRAFT_132943 [Chlorella variabilis]|eukprot:XP_005852012.1 hypothetical protein CHLNCDRAFT_132943 [Chlorella variabilis]
MAAAVSSAELQADSFKRLYPDQYLAKPTSIGLGVVSTADASALVKVGSTAALAGIKCEVMPASADTPEEGRLALQVELAPLCSADTRPGRPSEAAAVLTEQLSSLLEGAGVVDRRQLCIDPGKAAWAVYVDVYVLDADGSLHDACLLAVLAALSSLRLHAVAVDDTGRIQKAPADAAAAGAAGAQRQQGAADGAATALQQQPQGHQRRPLLLACHPVSLTCGLYRDRLLVDPTAEEEPLLEAAMTTTVDESGDILGFYKAGGSATLSRERMLECIEAAKQRSREVRGLLQQALEAAAAAPS